ncbi:MAG: hypothetical protein M3P26_08230 [Gemmatimonadota bacterium]|nr:hypothetical protein [Gemmatimonadota bacterium]
MKLLPCTFILSLLAVNVHGQEHAAHASLSGAAASAEVVAFVSAARLGTERYRDRNVAIAAGFRRLGRDFPSMGEHWANPGKVIAGRFDVADPAMLIYATIDGKPVLLGVVYAIPLESGQPPPPLPGGAKAWHEHNGTVNEESFLPEHGGDHSPERAGTRLAILHVWTLLPNPAGHFAAENWALPFARLHLETPPAIPEPAARALSLVSGSEDFYASFLESELPSASRDEWRAALAAATDSARAIVSARDAKDALSREQISALEKTWTRFAARISERSPALGRRLAGEMRDGHVR